MTAKTPQEMHTELEAERKGRPVDLVCGGWIGVKRALCLADALTDREQRVMSLRAEGVSFNAIARLMGAPDGQKVRYMHERALCKTSALLRALEST